MLLVYIVILSTSWKIQWTLAVSCILVLRIGKKLWDLLWKFWKFVSFLFPWSGKHQQAWQQWIHILWSVDLLSIFWFLGKAVWLSPVCLKMEMLKISRCQKEMTIKFKNFSMNLRLWQDASKFLKDATIEVSCCS